MCVNDQSVIDGIKSLLLKGGGTRSVTEDCLTQIGSVYPHSPQAFSTDTTDYTPPGYRNTFLVDFVCVIDQSIAEETVSYKINLMSIKGFVSVGASMGRPPYRTVDLISAAACGRSLIAPTEEIRF